MSDPSRAYAAAIDAAAAREVSPWGVFAIASAAIVLVSIDATMLFSVFGAMRASFPGATAASLSWVLNGYTIVYAAMLIPAGGVSDAYGRKRVFLTGVAVFIVASAVCGLAPDVVTLVGARAVQAVGAALALPASLSIVLAAFPLAQRALVVSAWGAVGGFAAALGPSLGSLVTETIGWPWAFFINLPVGALTLAFGLRWLEPSARGGTRTRVDLVGMALLIVAVGALTLAIVEADAWGLAALLAVASVGALSGAGFVVWARAAADPLINLELFRDSTYSAVNAATFTFGVSFSIMFFAFFFFMTDVWRLGQLQAGVAIAPGPLMVMPVAIVTGRLAGRYGHRPFLIGGSLIYASAGLWLLLVPGAEPAYFIQWLPGLLLSGTGVGLVLPSLAGAAVARLPAARYAIGSAVNQAARQVGGSVGVAITVLLLGHGVAQRADFHWVYGAHIALALLTGALCVFVNTRPAPVRS